MTTTTGLLQPTNHNVDARTYVMMSHIGAAGLIFKDTLNDLVFELEFARGPPASTRTPRASKARTRHNLASTRDPVGMLPSTKWLVKVDLQRTARGSNPGRINPPTPNSPRPMKRATRIENENLHSHSPEAPVIRRSHEIQITPTVRLRSRLTFGSDRPRHLPVWSVHRNNAQVVIGERTCSLVSRALAACGPLIPFIQGFPEEDTSRGAARVKGWNAGCDSASDALGIHLTHELLRRLRQLVGQAVSNKTTFIQGFYNESLTDALARHHSFQPVLLVDLDCDLHVSTMDAFKWLMRHRLLMPLSLVRYDDFGAPGMVGSSPQALAHEQASARWGLEWRSLGATRSARAFQLLSIGKPAGLFTGVF